MEIRLDRYLSNAGLGSRSQVRKLIKLGSVRVNGRVVKNASFEVNEGDVVEYLGKTVEAPKHLYFIMNKPTGYVCDRTEDATVFDLIDHPRVDQLHVAGRLDRDVEGLIILTTDGHFTHVLIDPKSLLEREYIVQVRGLLTEKMKRTVESGISVGKVQFAPATIEQVQEGLVRLILTEGKYHEVKRILKSIGLEYERIRRVRFANLTLNDLKPGEWRSLSDTEINQLLRIAMRNRKLRSRSREL